MNISCDKEIIHILDFIHVLMRLYPCAMFICNDKYSSQMNISYYMLTLMKRNGSTEFLYAGIKCSVYIKSTASKYDFIIEPQLKLIEEFIDYLHINNAAKIYAEDRL